MTDNELVQVKEVLGDLVISLMNHSKGLDEIEYKRTQDRINAINFSLSLFDEVDRLRELNDNLTRNVFTEDSPALKFMVETCKQQKDIISDLQAKLSELDRAN